jgi:hypothetical protein
VEGGVAQLRRGESNVKREKKTNIVVEESSVLIRIQHFRLKTDPDPIRIQSFDAKNWKEFTAEKKNFGIKLQFTYP